MEELYADRLAEQYEMLAYHFAKAEVWDKALDYLLKAAEKAAQAFATREALALYDQAEEAARRYDGEARPDTRRIHQARADLYLLVSDFERAPRRVGRGAGPGTPDRRPGERGRGPGRHGDGCLLGTQI